MGLKDEWKSERKLGVDGIMRWKINKFLLQVADAVTWIISLSAMCSILCGFLPLQQFENNNSFDWAKCFLHRRAQKRFGLVLA